MKKIILALALATVWFPAQTTKAQTITVANFSDSGTGSLRAAITGGYTTINVPTGTYNLTSGELQVAPGGSKTILIQSSGGQAVINQTDGNNRVFNIDPNSLGGVTVTLSGLTVQGGHDGADNYGGAGILDGSVSATPKDVLNLINCSVLNNHCKVLNATYTGQPGGGVQMAGGDLNITGCIFSNNTSAASQGGAIEFLTQTPVDSNLRITNSFFVNNGLTNTSGSGPDGGGAINIGSTASSTHVITGSTFSNNIAGATAGSSTVGGAIYLNTGVLTVNNSTFTTNATTSQGGAIDVDSGTLNMSFCRIIGNTAPGGGTGVYNHGSNLANTSAANNWWASNNGPGLAAASDGGTLTTSPFIVLTNTASPASILVGQSTILTASFLQNSAGTALTPSQISVLLGLPVIWNNPVLGTLASPQTPIQANGTATATFNAGNTSGAGQASATVDGVAATATVTINCPTITGNVSGGGTACPGTPVVVSVTINGGVPPYSVTLNNGGGTQTGSSPLLFSVSPASTTTYQISSGQDADNCPVAGSGSATATISSVPTAVITPSPASVLANSSGNQAGAPTGYASYAWTIGNGFIIGPTNLPAISYVAGVSGSVALGLTAVSPCGGNTNLAINVPIVTGTSIHTNLTFTNAIPATTMGIAFDGTNYWDCSGGSSSGIRLGRYTLPGALIATYSPGLDFRSVFTRADGTVLARAYNDSTIYQQTSPGVFINSGITLTGGTLNSQSAAVLNGACTEYDAMSGGVVSRWTTNGTYLGSVNLNGFGSLSGETIFPQNRGLAAFGNLWLTYNGGGILSAWDTSGNRLFQTLLPGAGTSFDSDYSFSCCNGKVFIVDVAGGLWRAFDISSGAAVAVLTAESTTAWNTDVASKLMGVGSLPKVDIISVTGSTPSLAQLRSYQSVMVYSDGNFNDSVAMGNVLADYIDQGGGVVIQTFGFYNGSGLGLLGRISNGYLPFTTASYTAPGNLTLVKDLPLHPLLDGVNSFNGGTSSYLNSSISIVPGATLVAHWSNGQPLVGTTNKGPGRITGLNFFPPSSDVRSDLWVSSTDGARLMANALLWSGRIPPTILTAPADQVVALGKTASFSVVAAGTSPLGYQWRLNGTNLPSVTNSSLSFTVQTGNLGNYSVVVSNPYGQTYSVNATLNPPLRFLPPSLAGGNVLPLWLANADGSLVVSNRAARVQLYAATNLAQPFNLWMPLTNAVLPNSGLLQVNGLSTTNPANRFFRAQEIP